MFGLNMLTYVLWGFISHEKLFIYQSAIYYPVNESNSKTCLKRPLLKRPKIGFQDQLSLNEGQKYCRMLQGEHSAILSTFNKLPFCHLDLCFVYFK